VLDTGTDISGGYAGRGTPGTDTDTEFCTHHQTRTPTRHTHTHYGGFVTENHVRFHFIISFSLFYYLFSNNNITSPLPSR
jgi:hypothetical protein